MALGWVVTLPSTSKLTPLQHPATSLALLEMPPYAFNALVLLTCARASPGAGWLWGLSCHPAASPQQTQESDPAPFQFCLKYHHG